MSRRKLRQQRDEFAQSATHFRDLTRRTQQQRNEFARISASFSRISAKAIATAQAERTRALRAEAREQALLSWLGE